jgi:hypothetical protein
VVSSTPRPHFNPGKDPVTILQEAGWAPGTVWTGGNSRPHRDSIPDRPDSSSSAVLKILTAATYTDDSPEMSATYGVSIGGFLQAFRNEISLSSSRVRQSKKNAGNTYKTQLCRESCGCPETTVTNYQFMLRKITKERGSHLRGGGSLITVTLFR